MAKIQKSRSSGVRQKRILIVDDDESLLGLFSLIVEETGCKAVTATDGKSLMHLQQNLPDLIILDVFLSREDGRTLCKQLKSHAVTKNIPVILSSSHYDVKNF